MLNVIIILILSGWLLGRILSASISFTPQARISLLSLSTHHAQSAASVSPITAATFGSPAIPLSKFRASMQKHTTALHTLLFLSFFQFKLQLPSAQISSRRAVLILARRQDILFAFAIASPILLFTPSFSIESLIYIFCTLFQHSAISLLIFDSSFNCLILKFPLAFINRAFRFSRNFSLKIYYFHIWYLWHDSFLILFQPSTIAICSRSAVKCRLRNYRASISVSLPNSILVPSFYSLLRRHFFHGTNVTARISYRIGTSISASYLLHYQLMFAPQFLKIIKISVSRTMLEADILLFDELMRAEFRADISIPWLLALRWGYRLIACRPLCACLSSQFRSVRGRWAQYFRYQLSYAASSRSTTTARRYFQESRVLSDFRFLIMISHQVAAANTFIFTLLRTISLIKYGCRHQPEWIITW